MYSVILVEDEDIIRRGIKNSVPWEEFNCSVVGEARNGEEGGALIAERNPDIVITDINMPVEDGLQMIARTKCAYDYVAIILTGYSDFEYAREAIRNGVSYYVLKPLDMEEMKEALERAALELKNIGILRREMEDREKLKHSVLIPEPDSMGGMDPVASQILDFIARNYDQKIALADLEEELHYSERYLNQRFQKALGTTVIEYLNRYRIQKALAMLRDEGNAISDIGWKCGIGDYKYFSYVFKKYMGRAAVSFVRKAASSTSWQCFSSRLSWSIKR